jgi:hypothetical protein
MVMLPLATSAQVVTGGGGGDDLENPEEIWKIKKPAIPTRPSSLTVEEIHAQLMRQVSRSWKRCYPLQFHKKYKDIMDVYNHILILKIPVVDHLTVNIDETEGCYVKKKQSGIEKCFFGRKGIALLAHWVQHPQTEKFLKDNFSLDEQKAKEVIKFYKDFAIWE